MPNGIEADGVQLKRLLDGGGDFDEWEGLQQPSQLCEALRQLPAGEWRRLIECPGLVFEQHKIVQRIVDGHFSLVAVREGTLALQITVDRVQHLAA